MRGENRQKGEIKHRKKYTKQKNTSFEWNQMQRYEFLMPFGLRQTKIHAKKKHISNTDEFVGLSFSFIPL